MRAAEAPRAWSGCGQASSSFPPVSRGRVESDGRCVRYVEAFHPFADREPRKGVAMRLDIVADPLPFGAEHQSDPGRAERIGKLGFGLAGKADAPEAGFGDLVEGAGEVHDPDPRHDL